MKIKYKEVSDDIIGSYFLAEVDDLAISIEPIEIKGRIWWDVSFDLRSDDGWLNQIEFACLTFKKAKKTAKRTMKLIRKVGIDRARSYALLSRNIDNSDLSDNDKISMNSLLDEAVGL